MKVRNILSVEDLIGERDSFYPEYTDEREYPLFIYNFIDRLPEEANEVIEVPETRPVYGREGILYDEPNWDEITTYFFFVFTETERKAYPQTRDYYAIEIIDAPTFSRISYPPDFELFKDRKSMEREITMLENIISGIEIEGTLGKSGRWG